jgi:hypothetical protein
MKTLALVVATATVCAVLTAGCGGSTSTTSTAGPYDALLKPRVIRSGEFPGYSPPSGVHVYSDPRAWSQQVGPPVDPNKEAARLRRLGFVAGLAEYLTRPGGSGEGLSVVERLGSPAAARQEVVVFGQKSRAAHSGAGDTFATFAAPAIPGARAYSLHSDGTRGLDVTFADGPYYYLVGAGGPAGAADAATRAQVLAAATTLYRRVHQLH